MCQGKQRLCSCWSCKKDHSQLFLVKHNCPVTCLQKHVVSYTISCVQRVHSQVLVAFSINMPFISHMRIMQSSTLNISAEYGRMPSPSMESAPKPASKQQACCAAMFCMTLVAQSHLLGQNIWISLPTAAAHCGLVTESFLQLAR